MPKESIMRDQHSHIREIILQILHEIDPNLINLLHKKQDYQLVEEAMKDFIEQLQKECHVIGLTARSPIHIIDLYLDELTQGYLTKLGINFSQPHYKKKQLTKFTHSQPEGVPLLFQKDSAVIPVFNYGIGFCGGIKKSEVLAELLHLFPGITHIVLFDDSYRHLVDLEDFCKGLNIHFTGYHYLGAQLHDHSLNHKKLARQFAHCIQTGQWLE